MRLYIDYILTTVREISVLIMNQLSQSLNNNNNNNTVLALYNDIEILVYYVCKKKNGFLFNTFWSKRLTVGYARSPIKIIEDARRAMLAVTFKNPP